MRDMIQGRNGEKILLSEYPPGYMDELNARLNAIPPVTGTGMLGALLAYMLRRRLPLLIGSVILAVLVLITARLMPFEWFCSLWALALCGGVYLAARFDTGEDA